MLPTGISTFNQRELMHGDSQTTSSVHTPKTEFAQAVDANLPTGLQNRSALEGEDDRDALGPPAPIGKHQPSWDPFNATPIAEEEGFQYDQRPSSHYQQQAQAVTEATSLVTPTIGSSESVRSGVEGVPESGEPDDWVIVPNEEATKSVAHLHVVNPDNDSDAKVDTVSPLQPSISEPVTVSIPALIPHSQINHDQAPSTALISQNTVLQAHQPQIEQIIPQHHVRNLSDQSPAEPPSEEQKPGWEPQRNSYQTRPMEKKRSLEGVSMPQDNQPLAERYVNPEQNDGNQGNFVGLPPIRRSSTFGFGLTPKTPQEIFYPEGKNTKHDHESSIIQDEEIQLVGGGAAATPHSQKLSSVERDSPSGHTKSRSLQNSVSTTGGPYVPATHDKPVSDLQALGSGREPQTYVPQPQHAGGLPAHLQGKSYTDQRLRSPSDLNKSQQYPPVEHALGQFHSQQRGPPFEGQHLRTPSAVSQVTMGDLITSHIERPLQAIRPSGHQQNQFQQPPSSAQRYPDLFRNDQASQSTKAEDEGLPAHYYQAPMTREDAFLPRQQSTEYQLAGVGPPADEPQPGGGNRRNSGFFKDIGGRLSRTGSRDRASDGRDNQLLPNRPFGSSGNDYSASSIASDDGPDKSKRRSFLGLGRSSTGTPPQSRESMVTHMPGSRTDLLQSPQPSPLAPPDRKRSIFGGNPKPTPVKLNKPSRSSTTSNLQDEQHGGKKKRFSGLSSMFGRASGESERRGPPPGVSTIQETGPLQQQGQPGLRSSQQQGTPFIPTNGGPQQSMYQNRPLPLAGSQGAMGSSSSNTPTIGRGQTLTQLPTGPPGGPQTGQQPMVQRQSFGSPVGPQINQQQVGPPGGPQTSRPSLGEQQINPPNGMGQQVIGQRQSFSPPGGPQMLDQQYVNQRQSFGSPGGSQAGSQPSIQQGTGPHLQHQPSPVVQSQSPQNQFQQGSIPQPQRQQVPAMQPHGPQGPQGRFTAQQGPNPQIQGRPPQGGYVQNQHPQGQQLQVKPFQGHQGPMQQPQGQSVQGQQYPGQQMQRPTLQGPTIPQQQAQMLHGQAGNLITNKPQSFPVSQPALVKPESKSRRTSGGRLLSGFLGRKSNDQPKEKPVVTPIPQNVHPQMGQNLKPQPPPWIVGSPDIRASQSQTAQAISPPQENRQSLQPEQVQGENRQPMPQSLGQNQERGRSLYKEPEYGSVPVPGAYSLVRGEGSRLAPTSYDPRGFNSNRQLNDPRYTQQDQMRGQPPQSQGLQQYGHSLYGQMQGQQPVSGLSQSAAAPASKRPSLGNPIQQAATPPLHARPLSSEDVLARSPARKQFGQQAPYQLSLPDDSGDSDDLRDRPAQSERKFSSDRSLPMGNQLQAKPITAAARGPPVVGQLNTNASNPSLRHPMNPETYPLPDSVFSPVNPSATNLPAPPLPKWDSLSQSATPPIQGLDRSNTINTQMSDVSSTSGDKSLSVPMAGIVRPGRERAQSLTPPSPGRSVTSQRFASPSSDREVAVSPPEPGAAPFKHNTHPVSPPVAEDEDIYGASPRPSMSHPNRSVSNMGIQEHFVAGNGSRYEHTRTAPREEGKVLRNDLAVTTGSGHTPAGGHHQEEKIWNGGMDGGPQGFVAEMDADPTPMMSATSYPGMEWNPYGGGNYEEFD
jgi:hypothetical protein